MKMRRARNSFVSLQWWCLTEQWTNQHDTERSLVWQASQQQCLPQHRLLVAASEEGMQPRAHVSSHAWCRCQVVMMRFLSWVDLSNVCMWHQPAARAPYLLRPSDAGARTPPLGIWCPCPPPLPLTASVQPPPRTPRCSPALVPQVQTTQRLEDSGGMISCDSVCTFRHKLGGLFCLFFFSFFLTVLPNEVDMSSPLIYGTPSSRVEGTPRSGVRGTPARQRPDLGSVRKAPQVDLHSEPVSGFRSILRII